jgi:phage terminase large subunit-like protein
MTVEDAGRLTSDLADIVKEFEFKAARRRLFQYRPYGHPDTLWPDGALCKEDAFGNPPLIREPWSNKPWQKDFHDAGKHFRYRMITQGNRGGKTYPAAAEMAMHLTGMYPDWWDGYRFNRSIDAWACGITQQKTRDVIQKLLIGDVTLPKDSNKGMGTGFIPAECLTVKPVMRHANIAGVVDMVRVRRVDGDYSTLIFKAYKQGKRDFQSDSCDLIWMDEEPDETNSDEHGIFSESLMRLVDRGGIMMITMALLMGETELVRHFHEGKRGTCVITAEWGDSPHITKDVREETEDNIPEHERDARMRGQVLLGTGPVFKVSPNDIKVAPFEIPKFYWQICGVDFGVDHPAAGVWLAIDRDADVWYLTDCYRMANQFPVYHAKQIKRRGAWIPVAWPHDGMKRGPADGKIVKDAYEEEGLNMLPISARYDRDSGGGMSREPIIMELNERMMTGRFKAFSTCHDFFDEMKSYHRDEKGKIVDRRDDIISALCYAGMMQAYAAQEVLRVEQPFYTQALIA